MQSQIKLKKSVLGATSVTLIPSTASDGANRGEAGITQVVITTGAAVPPVGFWGSVLADGQEYLLILRRVS
jgi:hypothetical protein